LFRRAGLLAGLLEIGWVTEHPRGRLCEQEAEASDIFITARDIGKKRS
jgi:hypothetical protein